MTNIFNLFLFLFSLWLLLMFASNNISWLYFYFGLISASLIAIISFKINLIKKDSHLLYLSLGFYYHFLKVFFSNFLKSMKLIFAIAFDREPIKPKIYKVTFNEEMNFNEALLIATINMTAGLLFIGFGEHEISIHTIDKRYFAEFELKKIILNINKTNDDSLI